MTATFTHDSMIMDVTRVYVSSHDNKSARANGVSSALVVTRRLHKHMHKVESRDTSVSSTNVNSVYFEYQYVPNCW